MSCVVDRKDVGVGKSASRVNVGVVAFKAYE
jgi:hypothetical protein